MFSRKIRRAALAAALIALSGCASAGTHPPRKTLQAFASEHELAQLFAKWSDERRRRDSVAQRSAESAAPMMSKSAPAPASAPAGVGAADSVTNVQHAGVDEGGIVKVHGNHLVILRRGRLFTVNVGDEQLRPVAAVDAFGSGVEPRGAWYDEMLISGNTIAVIGYSYARGGTEIGLFDISSAGELTYRSTYHLRSND